MGCVLKAHPEILKNPDEVESSQAAWRTVLWRSSVRQTKNTHNKRAALTQPRLLWGVGVCPGLRDQLD